MRVSDFIIKLLENHGVKHIFLVTGGGAMHLNDAIKKSNLKPIFNHHEQACAIAAEGYSRASGKIGVLNVTTGPGCTNALTGVLGAWTDSIPMLVISGQVKYETTVISCEELGLRQLGDQELNIVPMAKNITKYAKTLVRVEEVKKEILKAISIATTGRKGPVWIDVPLDIQGAIISQELMDEEIVDDWSNDSAIESKPDYKNFNITIDKVVSLLKMAKRPVVIAGHGITLAGAKNELKEFLEKTKIPAVTTFNGFDLLSTSSESFAGRVGTIGTRSGNFAVQNADVVLSIGTRNNIRQVSYAWKFFAREAKKIVVDIDARELAKKTVVPELGVHADAKIFLQSLLGAINTSELENYTNWRNWCLERREKYSPVLEEYYTNTKKVQPYIFMEKLTGALPSDSIVVAGNGSACVTLFQAGQVREGHKTFWNSGTATMGYDLPASIGAAFATGKRIHCLAGDGSIMMNLQELQTIINYKLPVTVYLLNNDGYQSIKQTQNTFFKGDIIGCDTESGVSFPNFSKLAEALGYPVIKIESNEDIDNKIPQILEKEGPLFVEVMLDIYYTFQPKLSSKKLPNGKLISKPLEDMFPFLPRDEFASNMIIKPLEEE